METDDEDDERKLEKQVDEDTEVNTCSRFIETQSGQSTLYIVVGARAYWSLGETYHVRHSHFCVPPLLVYRSQLLVCHGALNTK